MVAEVVNENVAKGASLCGYGEAASEWTKEEVAARWTRERTVEISFGSGKCPAACARADREQRGWLHRTSDAMDAVDDVLSDVD